MRSIDAFFDDQFLNMVLHILKILQQIMQDF